MTSTAVVRAECPTCGAPLGFDDGVGAMRCDHCRSPLLVTGRRDVLSYRIVERMGESEARSLVRFALPAERQDARIETGRLHLLPYHRITAEELSWEESEWAAEERRRRNVLEVAAWFQAASPETSLLGGGRGACPPPVSDLDERDRFGSRVVERNVLARDTSVVPPSLGVRAGVLQLHLFDPARLPPETVVVAPTTSPPSLGPGECEGGRSPDGRRVWIREVVQIVYFPFWMFPVDDHGRRTVSVVDAVAGSRVACEAEPEAIEALGDGAGPRARILGFRPLACPNCGWDLPLRPNDVVFQCPSCERGWLSRGESMESLSFSVVPGGAGDRHLPVWRLRSAADGGAAPIFAPAFRCRRLKAVVDLGMRLTRRSMDPPRTDEIPAGLVGCALDAQDAHTLARFVLAGIAAEGDRGATRTTLPDGNDSMVAELLWLPFASDGYSWREPLTGSPVPRRLLDL